MIAALSDGLEVKEAAEEAASCPLQWDTLQQGQSPLEGAVELTERPQEIPHEYFLMQSVDKVKMGREGLPIGSQREKIPPPPRLNSRPISSYSQELLSKRLPASSQLSSPLAGQAVVTRQRMGGCCSVVCG